MAYTNRTIRLSFDGTDEKYPTLGDDIWIVIANPMLMPPSKLRPKVDVALGPDGMPLNVDDAMLGSMEIVANLVVDWSVYNPNDFSEEPAKLPLPATADLVSLLPMAITTAVTDIIQKAVNPQ